MKPASKRSTRSRIALNVGPLTVTVHVFAGVARPESPKSYCTGHEDAPHSHTELKTRGRYCPLCGDDSGKVVQAFKADDGALMPIGAGAQAERLGNVEALRDKMDLVAVTPETFSQHVIESGNIYWLVPSSPSDQVNYLGLRQAIVENGLVLVTSWASRTVAKLYRIGVHVDMLTLTELVPADELRAAPVDPPTADAQKIAKSAAMFMLAMEPATADELAELAVDPGRAALRKAANAARIEGADSLKIKRGERVMFAQRAAEAALAAELEQA